MVEICSLGGYVEIGRNMTAIKYLDSVVILDMGLHLDPYIRYTQDEDALEEISYETLREIGAVADLDPIEHWHDDVKMLVPTHAHLDHVGAVPYMAPLFDAPLLCTPFTNEIIKSIMKDNKMELDNKVIVLNENSTYKVDENISIEFIHVTHSIPQTVLVAVHTPDGVICYGNDFKFDPFPVLGKPTNVKRLKELGDSGVLAFVGDCTRAHKDGKTDSESIAREKLRDVLEGVDATGNAIVITTFSSHIARIKSILSLAKRLDRKVVFIGRSLGRYCAAAEEINLVNFSDEVKICRYPDQVRKELKKVNERPEDYILVVTGHQGEPQAILSRIAFGLLPFKLRAGDHVIFASQIIPTPTNLENRESLDAQLRELGCRIFNDVHVSGHGSKEDLRELLSLLRPKHILPSHGYEDMRNGLVELSKQMGYKEKTIHMMETGDILEL